ncbi:MAG: M20/M25/M40 family metallo-hydrolase [Niastella sp.]|nr:M20/M25/M40 family metallo-hydrolase [Niastella sp.]
MKKLYFLLAFMICIQISLFAQIDIAKIRTEGLNNSQVMDIAFNLTDASGPRLTNSPGYFKAANWAVNELKKWGLTHVALEPWGEFGKGWELEKSYIAMTAPYYRPLIGFPKTWTKGTSGLKSAELILIDATDSATLEAYRGKLKNKIIIVLKKDSIRPSFKPDAKRYTDEELEKMQQAKLPTADPANGRNRRNQMFGNRGTSFSSLLKAMATQEGALALLSTNTRGKDGTLFVSGGGGYAKDDAENITDLMIAYEDYMLMQRLLSKGIPVKIDLDVVTQFYTQNLMGHNVVAEIEGTDAALKSEIVMLGGHLDSWQGSVGATDNAAGAAVMMEAVRIIKTSGIQPRRTIRIALWDGEEQGLHGSRNYVKNHFADPATMQLKPEFEKVSAYYNLDNGTGKIRGIYLQGNDAARSIFTEWLKPFNDLGATTVTISNTGGTDHLAFDAVGIPGFQFIQDPIEYNTRTHHTNMDSYEHLLPEDLKQAATIIAAFVLNTANRDERIPRKPLPEPRGK